MITKKSFLIGIIGYLLTSAFSLIFVCINIDDVLAIIMIIAWFSGMMFSAFTMLFRTYIEALKNE